MSMYVFFLRIFLDSSFLSVTILLDANNATSPRIIIGRERRHFFFLISQHFSFCLYSSLLAIAISHRFIRLVTTTSHGHHLLL